VTAATVRLERDGAVARLVLDRPPVNVLDIATLEALAAAIEAAAADPAVKVVVLAGAGKAFCAGVDVADHTADRVERMLTVFHGVVRRLLALEVPVVGAVHGAALGGGCELALACDVVLARDDLRLGQPEIKLAVFPPAACVLLPALCHRGVAAEMLYGGEPITAAEAREEGLVRRVVPPDQLEASADSLAQCIARHSGAALRFTKRCVRDAWVVQRELLFRASRLYVDNLMGTDDAVAGLAGFLEKRHPVWRHE
jgi:cyclohexa-1,5-dienecarbonyl-CoA hydratase